MAPLSALADLAEGAAVAQPAEAQRAAVDAAEPHSLQAFVDEELAAEANWLRCVEPNSQQVAEAHGRQAAVE